MQNELMSVINYGFFFILGLKGSSVAKKGVVRLAVHIGTKMCHSFAVIHLCRRLMFYQSP